MVVLCEEEMRRKSKLKGCGKRYVNVTFAEAQNTNESLLTYRDPN